MIRYVKQFWHIYENIYGDSEECKNKAIERLTVSPAYLESEEQNADGSLLLDDKEQPVKEKNKVGVEKYFETGVLAQVVADIALRPVIILSGVKYYNCETYLPLISANEVDIEEPVVLVHVCGQHYISGTINDFSKYPPLYTGDMSKYSKNIQTNLQTKMDNWKKEIEHLKATNKVVEQNEST